MTVTDTSPGDALAPRERILAAAAHRYYSDGIRAASADRLMADAGVSKVTFYRHFPTKDHLVLAYLERTAQLERAAVLAERSARAHDPKAVLRWYADSVGQISCGPGFRGCPFINAAAELADPDHPGRRVITEHRDWLTAQAAELVSALGISDAADKAEQLMMLRDGAMMAGYLGRAPESVAAQLTAAGRAVLHS
jgi:AcrR family transcriptional regulator